MCVPIRAYSRRLRLSLFPAPSRPAAQRQQSRARARTIADIANTSPTPQPTDPGAKNWRMGFIPPAPLPGPSVFSPRAAPPRPIETKATKGVPPIGVTSPLGAGLGGVSLMEQMRGLERELESKALRNAAEEDTDNWDDDFEGGISFTKLQGKLSYYLCTFLFNHFGC
jgi:hypothetical protein